MLWLVFVWLALVQGALASDDSLTLSLFAYSIPPTGRDLEYLLSTNSSVPLSANLTVNCTNGYFWSAQVQTSSNYQTFSMPAQNYTNCTVIGSNESLESNSQYFYVANRLYLENPNFGFTIAVGQPFSIYTMTAVSSVRLPVTLYINCQYGSQTFESTTNVETRDHYINDTAMFGDCIAFGESDPVLFATQFKTGITVQTLLNLTEPSANQTFAFGQAVPFLAMANQLATNESIRFIFNCANKPRFVITGLANEETQYTFDLTLADSWCSVYAQGNFFSPSSSVSFYLGAPPEPIPTQLEADLNGWQGGGTVYVTVVSENGNLFSLQLNVQCAVSSQSFSIRANTLEALVLDDWLSGIGCIITTSEMPEAYAPITPVIVDVNLGPVAQAVISNQLNPFSFLRE